MSTNEGKLKASLADYFAYCDSIEGKAEYFDGEIFDMAGGTPEHAEIVSNVHYALRKRLEGLDCGVYTQDLRIEIQSGNAYVYPDLAVICDGLERSALDPNSVRNPCLIIEVISDGTAAFDFNGKRDLYMAISSVQAYILIRPKSPKVDTYARSTNNEWVFAQLSGLDTTLEISSLSVPVTIPLSEIYHRVTFST